MTDIAEPTAIQPITHSALELVDDFLDGSRPIPPELLKNVPSISERRAEVDLPEPVQTEDVLNHDLTFLAWRSQEALLVSEGTITNGYLTVGYDHTAKRKFVLFVGGIALVREFARLTAPVRATIEKRGRTLVLR